MAGEAAFLISPKELLLRWSMGHTLRNKCLDSLDNSGKENERPIVTNFDFF